MGLLKSGIHGYQNYTPWLRVCLRQNRIIYGKQAALPIQARDDLIPIAFDIQDLFWTIGKKHGRPLHHLHHVQKSKWIVKNMKTNLGSIPQIGIDQSEYNIISKSV